MKTSEFRKLIRKHLAPSLNEIGFTGTDHHFVKDNKNHVINAIVIQADKYGGSCVVELGVHFDFLPDTSGKFIPVNKLTVYDCEFRTRLVHELNWFQTNVLRKKNSEVWFRYGHTEEEARTVLQEMKEMIITQGTSYFTQFNDFPHALTSIKPVELSNRTKRLDRYGAPLNLRLALLLARTHTFLGNGTEAANFARWGLENIDRATGLIQDFTEIINCTKRER
ncbi:DUF4304 domain-containing protein [Paenibacillus thailandensis]|uniref:DUF4304 domain-containing protein n=1 Tax=Paenibacillus thailandensis TaxID=393250 RepID=A0ABW5QSR7_9BACL